VANGEESVILWVVVGGQREQVERLKREGGQEREADGVAQWKEELNVR